MPRIEVIQIVNLDNRNFINSYKIFDNTNTPKDVFDYIAQGLCDYRTFKIEIKRITVQKGNATPKTQDVTAKQTDKQTTNKKAKRK